MGLLFGPLPGEFALDRQSDPRTHARRCGPSKRQLRSLQLAQGDAIPGGGVGLHYYSRDSLDLQSFRC